MPIRLRKVAPVKRQGKTLAHAVQVNLVAVIVRDHGHAGKAAFRRLGGDYDRQLAASGDDSVLKGS